MANFQTAFAKTMVVEGGYANDPDDTGGETYMGIARKHNPAWAGWRLVDQHKSKPGRDAVMKNDRSLQELVRSFYKVAYWDVNKLDQIVDQSIAEEMFDTGVNMGVEIAARFLQTALNVLNRNQVDYPNISVDGAIGPATLKTINTHKSAKLVFKVLNILQGARYLTIADKNEKQEKFMRSWLSRVEFL
ncbi:glycoside hydrolase family 108 protein [Pedobacter sp. SYP-B3415]|uniref:glycoside hydrolase family 108 protein n=1 Tax=Pedobacter sp. SYP-B3415 TaxID=2496641 RepID=UPI00101B79C5|nr:glycosyl hydrolase 108 family protein [Pedobacter sp. SYP-B3415]